MEEEIFILHVEQKIFLFPSVKMIETHRSIRKNYVASRLDAEYINGMWSGRETKTNEASPLSFNFPRRKRLEQTIETLFPRNPAKLIDCPCGYDTG